MHTVAPVRRSRRSLVISVLCAAAAAGGLAYLIAIWPAPEPFKDPFPQPSGLMPMTSGDAFGKLGEGHCLDMLDEWVRHPNWQVNLTRSHGDSLTVHADGRTIYTPANGPVRARHITPAEIVELHAAASQSCERKGNDGAWIEVDWGARAMGVRVARSPAMAQLETFFVATAGL